MYGGTVIGLYPLWTRAPRARWTAGGSGVARHADPEVKLLRGATSRPHPQQRIVCNKRALRARACDDFKR